MATKRIGLATEVITLEEAREHCRITAYGSPLEHPDDSYLEALISSAREWLEDYLARSIGTQTLELALDVFPEAIQLTPYVQSVTSIKYIDTEQVEQTIDPNDYTLDNYSSPSWVVPAYNKVFPTVLNIPNAVKVRYVSGYDVDNPCPSVLKAAMLLMIGNLYENRQEDVVGATRISFNSLPMGIKNLVQSYRLGLGL